MEPQESRTLLLSRRPLFTRLPSGQDQERGFVPLYLRSVFPEQPLDFPLYLKTLGKGPQKIEYLPFYSPPEVFRTDWLTQLQEQGFDRLYVRQQDLDRAIAYLNNVLLLLESDDAALEKTKLMVFYDHLKFSFQRSLSRANLQTDFPVLVKQADFIFQALEKGTFPGKALWEVLCLEYSVYNHSMNVFMIAMGFMAFLKKDQGECRLMGVAALFHDVGLTKVPREILYKPEALTEEDWKTIKKHPLLSFNMLKACPAVPLDALRLIHEHHENQDGTGYPQGLRLWAQHPHTQILHLVDAYDAMTSQRPYRPPYTARQALEIIGNSPNGTGNPYDQGILKNFIRFIGATS